VTVKVKPTEPAKTEEAKPPGGATTEFRFKVDPERTRVPEGLDAGKLEALEKKLKDLQDEVERLKKGSAPGGAK
jgi:hypothetical protein